MAGVSSDHTDAATITPEARPNSDFCNFGDMSFFMKKTKAALSMVPNKGINKPIVIPMSWFCECARVQIIPTKPLYYVQKKTALCRLFWLSKCVIYYITVMRLTLTPFSLATRTM